MTTTLGRWSAPRANDVEHDDLLVAIGLVSGAHFQARVGRRGAQHVLDRLNNFLEPMLQLSAATHAGGTSARLVLARSELAWAYPLQAMASGPAQAGGSPVAQTVHAHVGAFEVRGTPQLFHQVEWADFLLACSNDGRFFALADAHITGPATDLQVPVLAVNAARVGALLTLD
jgi:hypothetical protein